MQQHVVDTHTQANINVELPINWLGLYKIRGEAR